MDDQLPHAHPHPHDLGRPAPGRHPGAVPDAPVRPDYLVEPAPDLHRARPDQRAPGRDVLETMFWLPFVTFWQVTADLPVATAARPATGHKYTTEYVDGFNAIIRAAGITPGT